MVLRTSVDRRRRWLAAAFLTAPMLWLAIVDRAIDSDQSPMPTAEIAWHDDGSLSLDVHRPEMLPGNVLVTDTGVPGTGAAARQAGIAIGNDAHVSVLPPFVVLTRDQESITVERHAHRLGVDGPLPAWVRRDDHARLIVRLGIDLHAVIDRRGLRLHRGGPPPARI